MIKYFIFFKATSVSFGRFSKSFLLCKSSSNFVAIVTKISGIPSSLFLLRLSLFNSASNNRLKINKNFYILWLSMSISACLLQIVTNINSCSYFIFLENFVSFSEISNPLLLVILVFVLLVDLFLGINFY